MRCPGRARNRVRADGCGAPVPFRIRLQGQLEDDVRSADEIHRADPSDVAGSSHCSHSTTCFRPHHDTMLHNRYGGSLANYFDAFLYDTCGDYTDSVAD